MFKKYKVFLFLNIEEERENRVGVPLIEWPTKASVRPFKDMCEGVHRWVTQTHKISIGLHCIPKTSSKDHTYFL
jgi:hypothetical protein